jgi:6-phosphogluconolactonase
MIKPVWSDHRRELVVPGDTEKTLTFCVSHFLMLARQAIEDHGAFYVALSGGSTPKAIYQRLRNEATSIDWSSVHLFWSDERCVPPSDPESNYFMAMEAGLKTLPIPSSQIHRMKAESNVQAHAQEYETLIKTTLGDHPFDLIMLGMGEDGHTASLFPNTAGLQEKKHLVVANNVPQKSCWRMTMTLPCINRARHTTFYILGASKQPMLKQVLSSDSPTLPASLIGTPNHKALFIADTAATR